MEMPNHWRPLLNNIHYVQKLIEDNIIKDKIYKCSFSEEELQKYDKLFKELVVSEMNKMISLQDTYSNSFKYIIKKDIINQLINQLFLMTCPQILKYNLIVQQFYFLYILSILFYRYNEQELQLPLSEFIKRIYFPNILSLCSKYFIQSRRLLFKLIKKIYNEIKDDNIYNTSYLLYKENENNIKNNILQLFLINILPKFNPFDFENLEDFYTILFKRIFFFYLKSKKINSSSLQIQVLNTSDFLENQTERFKIYEDAIYLSQIQNICSKSTELNTIDLEFDRFKKIILPNEIQKLFLYKFVQSKNSTNITNKLNLFKLCSTNSPTLDKIKNKLPNIYRLLRSIHIMSHNTVFSEIDKNNMKTQFYNTLCRIFEKQFDVERISNILLTVSYNLTESLTTGEFIDMISLTQVEINNVKFVEQFCDFLVIMLSDTFDIK